MNGTLEMPEVLFQKLLKSQYTIVYSTSLNTVNVNVIQSAFLVKTQYSSTPPSFSPELHTLRNILYCSPNTSIKCSCISRTLKCEAKLFVINLPVVKSRSNFVVNKVFL